MDIIEGQGRMDRIQDAYKLASDIAHIFRDSEPEPATFSSQAWAAFDEWRAELEDEVGFQALGRIPVELLARYYLDCDTVTDATTMVEQWLAANPA
ncbi:MAG: hypothetical protein EON87_16080 [Brevundimonas sp.]|nr:MAG: hypothetical protein EON87_16080 [Brevundimonas sp.]